MSGPPSDPALLDDVRAGRETGVRWLCARIAPDGTPHAAERVNAWWRLPWTLVVAGEPAVAASVLAWAGREALTREGDLRPGPARAGAYDSPVYQLAPLAIAAWYLGRYGTARQIMTTLATFQDPVSGGARRHRDADQDDTQELLLTAQLGIAALVTGDRDLADGAYSFVRDLLDLQPELPRRLFCTRSGGDLVTDVDDRTAYGRVLDFQAPRQRFFLPGICAAFLAGLAGQQGGDGALPLARRYLALTAAGNRAAQFDDPDSIQVCKYGWGLAAMTTADPDGGWAPEAARMARWLLDRRRPDGAWAPSRFQVPAPDDAALLWKTAEHVLILALLEQALVGVSPPPVPRSDNRFERKENIA